ncbi:ATP-binding protein [Staphylothermus hellenicus]|uniref:Helicase HerA central domain-containing protein n=1 Tax=Staphylothermus hellenicus (strain DSM 12710 / JCM 10830 / BK20S6-10-b1 / P8) TaxID=591019 RepID=D7DA50_STAHD|nr:ATP-binding protein [Staphylothermus hellenicus]ADI32646.1 protein of unknown function DUF87 [Staphylothermus hellenicus DSM 12710]
MKPIIKYPRQEYLARFSGETIDIGEVINSKIPVKASIQVDTLTHHTLVVGSTGSGKTHTVSIIVNELVRKTSKYKVLIIDWHGEYMKLINRAEYLEPRRMPLNIIEHNNIYEFIELLQDSLGLTPPQVYILEKIFENKKYMINNIYDLRNVLENIEDQGSWFRESRLSLLRKISPLTRDGLREVFDAYKDKIIDYINICENPIIIDASRIQDPYIRRIYVSILLKKIFKEAVKRKVWSRNKLLVVLEEAHNVLGRNNYIGIVARMLSEIRKFGVGLVIVSQSPSQLVDEAMLNTNTKIIHSIKSLNDLEVISKSLYLPLNIEKIIPYLDVGEAVLYTRGLKKPVIIKVKEI